MKKEMKKMNKGTYEVELVYAGMCTHYFVFDSDLEALAFAEKANAHYKNTCAIESDKTKFGVNLRLKRKATAYE